MRTGVSARRASDEPRGPVTVPGQSTSVIVSSLPSLPLLETTTPRAFAYAPVPPVMAPLKGPVRWPVGVVELRRQHAVAQGEDAMAGVRRALECVPADRGGAGPVQPAGAGPVGVAERTGEGDHLTLRGRRPRPCARRDQRFRTDLCKAQRAAPRVVVRRTCSTCDEHEGGKDCSDDQTPASRFRPDTVSRPPATT